MALITSVKSSTHAWVKHALRLRSDRHYRQQMQTAVVSGSTLVAELIAGGHAAVALALLETHPFCQKAAAADDRRARVGRGAGRPAANCERQQSGDSSALKSTTASEEAAVSKSNKESRLMDVLEQLFSKQLSFASTSSLQNTRHNHGQHFHDGVTRLQGKGQQQSNSGISNSSSNKQGMAAEGSSASTPRTAASSVTKWMSMSAEALAKAAGLPSAPPLLMEVETPSTDPSSFERRIMHRLRSKGRPRDGDADRDSPISSQSSSSREYCHHHRRRWLILDRVSDPGNMGALLRSAHAFGWQGAYLVEPCVDPFNEKCIRASAGAVFHMPLAKGSWGAIASMLHGSEERKEGQEHHEELKDNQERGEKSNAGKANRSTHGHHPIVAIVADTQGTDIEAFLSRSNSISSTGAATSTATAGSSASSASSRSLSSSPSSSSSPECSGITSPSQLDDVQHPVPDHLAVILCAEADGPGDYIPASWERVTIPMVGDFDSLNVAVASGILLYLLRIR